MVKGMFVFVLLLCDYISFLSHLIIMLYLHDRLFALQDDISADILQVYNEKKAIIDLPQSSHFLTTANESINATVLRKSISQWLRITPWPAWDVSILDKISYYSLFLSPNFVEIL